jgi:Xaa-Pro dipeptidase
MRLAEIQDHLSDLGLAGWLLYDFQGSNPIARSVAARDMSNVTRRWFCFIPKDGAQRWLYHAIESSAFEGADGEHFTYGRWQELVKEVAEITCGTGPIAVEYSPGGEIPYISRVDAGTLELMRRLNLELVSSAELVQLYEARWSAEQHTSHLKAAEILLDVKDRTFEIVRERIGNGLPTTEYEVQTEMMKMFEENNLITHCPPIVAVKARTADPHYLPTEAQSQPVEKGDLLLLDLWGKLDVPGAVYADITWMACLSSQPKERHKEVFEVVRDARNRGIEFLREACSEGAAPAGYQVDDAVRKVVDHAGYGENFFHRTGHSIGIQDHGNGANIDNYETHDTRRLVKGVGFSIEPGIYLSGEFGVRSEIDVYMGQEGPMITTLPLQKEIVSLA